MAFVVGIAVAFTVSGFGRVTGFDRDRAFYPTMAVVIASYYVLFAVTGGSNHALVVELVVMGAFVVAAVIGFRSSHWVVAACLAAHGIFDVFHGLVVANPGVPAWWPAFCSAFDVGAAGILSWLLRRSYLEVTPGRNNIEGR
jgi:hypothetical protein